MQIEITLPNKISQNESFGNNTGYFVLQNTVKSPTIVVYYDILNEKINITQVDLTGNDKLVDYSELWFLHPFFDKILKKNRELILKDNNLIDEEFDDDYYYQKDYERKLWNER